MLKNMNLIFTQKLFVFQIKELLKNKNLSENIFETSTITLEDDLPTHVAWLFEHIYKIPYPNIPQKTKAIARFFHGIQHVSRAAMYVPTWANLYRRHDHPDACQLTDRFLKLIEIAVLLHDSAREAEEEDLWDLESATFLYFYLTRVLGVPNTEAKEIAEAMGNKDWSPGKEYYILLESRQGEILWKAECNRTTPKNIVHKLIHDADCLDVIRARDAFDATYLDFYHFLITLPDSSLAFDEMAQFILQAKSLIILQGDERRHTKAKIKIRYENPHAYTKIMEDLNDSNYGFLKTLYADGKLLSISELKKLTLIDPTSILNKKNQYIFARGIITPSALVVKRYKKCLPKRPAETLAALEFRKVNRHKGIPTRSYKNNKFEKEGNPKRSVSLIGHGGTVFADVGGLIFNPDRNAISQISVVDFDTGWGKKIKGSSASNDSDDDKTYATRQSKMEPLQNLNELEKKLKLGGSCRIFKSSGVATHTEIIYHVTHYDAIYYTHETTFSGRVFHGKPKNPYPYSAILKAIFLVKEYQRRSGGVILDIYEYSATNNYLKKIPPFTDDQIVYMWRKMCGHYIKKNFDDLIAGKNPYLIDINTIKIISMYKQFRTQHYTKVNPADCNYPAHLVKAINRAIEEEKTILFKPFILKKISGGTSLASPEIFTLLLGLPLLLAELAAVIEDAALQALQAPVIEIADIIRWAELSLGAPLVHKTLQQEARKMITLGIDFLSNNRHAPDFRADLIFFTRLACVFQLILEFKDAFSKLSTYRWFSFEVPPQSPSLIPNILIYFEDLIKALKLITQQHGQLELNCFNIFQFFKNTNNKFFLINTQLHNIDLVNDLKPFFNLPTDFASLIPIKNAFRFFPPSPTPIVTPLSPHLSCVN